MPNKDNSAVCGKPQNGLKSKGEKGRDIEKRVRKLAQETTKLAFRHAVSDEIEDESEQIQIGVQPSKYSIKAVANLVSELERDYPGHEVVVGCQAMSDVVYIYLKKDGGEQ
jgi:hypothetical protein